MKSKKSNLTAKLDAYDALSGGDRNGSSVSHQNWVVYAAVAGSSLAMGTAAEAAIIHGTVNQTRSIAGLAHNGSNQPGSSAQIAFPIDGGNATLDVQAYLTGGYYANGIVELKGNLAVFNAGPSHGSGRGTARKFMSGANISAGTGTLRGRGSVNLVNSTQHRGQFVAGQTAFAGIDINGDLGWIRLSFNKNSHGYPDFIKVVDWAYNDVAGAPIAAGQLPVQVPEPASGAIMAVLAAGAIGMRTWRKQRGHAVAA